MTDKTITVTAAHGVTFTARLLEEGDCYGPGQLFWLPVDRPGVEFFDTRYPHTEHGQFTGGRYYVDTLLENPVGGLCLDGGVADWRIDADAMDEVRAWLVAETTRCAEHPACDRGYDLHSKQCPAGV